MVELRVLGPIQGFKDGIEVDLGGPTQRRLLASLVAQPGEVVSVTALLGDLWGEDPPPSGPQSIQSYVSRLRRELGQDVIETKAPGYQLGSKALEIDSDTFLALVRDLPDDPPSRLPAIDHALGLWSGPPFENFDHVDFASRRLLETRYDLEEDRARLLAELGQGPAAVAALEKITAAEPLRESSWVALSRILTMLGRQAEAVRTLDRYRNRLADIGLEPGPAFSAAQDAVFDTPQPSQLTSRLPRIETTFLGRERELDQLASLIAERRLVTITGPGGMGKTRLAIEAARGIQGQNIAFAPLASLNDDREVGPSILHAIGGETRGNPTDSIVARLTKTPSLLLVDNAEHVIEAVASLVAEIVSRTDTVVVVTSREPLNVPGETILGLESLDPGAAIELFRDRASQVSPGFEASSATLDMLCEELDYMPLAIEMAAARSAAVSPDEILTRLSRRYGLLDRPRRGADQRHRSLDALVDWSYGLLDKPSQLVFQRLSVVAGSFDIDLATAVAGFGQVESEAVAGILADLVDKSLVRRRPSGRFRMLRVLKSYAAQQLESSGDLAETRTIHAKWFAELAGDIGDGLSTPAETSWIEVANAAVEDIDNALTWSVETEDLDSAQMILEGLFDWFFHRQPPAIVGWGERVLPVTVDHDVKSVAQAWAALAALKMGRTTEARDLALAGTVVTGEAGRFSWFITGEVACHQDRLDDALDAYRKQLVRASQLDDRIGVVDAMAGETLALAFQGVFDRAEDIAVDLERVAADIGAPTYRAYAAFAMGEAVNESDPERSAELLDHATELGGSVNNFYIQAMARTSMGSVLARLGRRDEAIDSLHEAMDLWETMGMPAYQWTVVQYLGAIVAETGDLKLAAQLLSSAQSAGRRPFGAGQSLWGKTFDDLRSNELYDEWAGAPLKLDEAVPLALSATRPHR